MNEFQIQFLRQFWVDILREERYVKVLIKQTQLNCMNTYQVEWERDRLDQP